MHRSGAVLPADDVGLRLRLARVHRERALVVLIGLGTVCAACGDAVAPGDAGEGPATTVELTPDPTVASEVVITATTVDPQTSEVQTTTSVASSATPAPTADWEASIETELGKVTYTVPAGSVVDPRPPTPPPDFALGQARWIVPDWCNLIVTLQNLEPPFPDEERTGTFTANGIRWNIYDSGARDGTLTIARGTAGPITVLVSAQSLSGDPLGSPTRPTTEAVTRSVIVQPS